MSKIFVAYPASPSDISATILKAKLDTTDPSIQITTWQRDDLGGSPLIAPILEAIEASDIVAADITRLNFNVTYELGYAIGRGKRGLPIQNNVLKNDAAEIARIGIFDTLLYENYANSDELKKLLGNASPGRRLATEFPKDPLPLYIVLPPAKTDDINRLTAMAIRAGLRPRTFDPLEQPRMSAPDAVRSVAASSGVLLPLISPDHKDAVIHNTRIAFVAGVSHALELPTLILQRGDWTLPADIRDQTKSYTTDEVLNKHFGEFAARAHDARYDALPPPAGNENYLASLNMGDPSAENEESLLVNYFLERDEFRQVLQGKANIVVGRKGAGKTAIFFEVRDRLKANKSKVVVDLSPDAYQLGKLKDVALKWLAAGSKEFLLSAFWEYVLLLEICGKLIEKDRDVHKRNHNLFEPYQRLLMFYKSETATAGLDFSDRLLRLIERLGQRYAAQFGNKTGVDLSDANLTNLLYETTLHDLRSEVMKYAAFKDGICLLFDNLDKGWNATGLEDTDVVMIRTLLDASRKLGNDFRKSGGEFFCTIFLRNDIYDMLLSHTPDRGKETIVLIDWHQSELLKQMMRKRLAFNAEVKNQTIESMWHKVAVPTFGGISSLDRLVDLSMMRPRYLLRLFNHCKGNATSFGRSRIDEDDFLEGISLYSTDIITQIDLEIRDVLPAAEEVLYVLLGERRTMRLSEIHALLKRATHEEAAREAIMALFLWHGVLGYQRDNDHSTYIFDVNYDLRRLRGLMAKAQGGDPIMQIHPALWSGLELA